MNLLSKMEKLLNECVALFNPIWPFVRTLLITEDKRYEYSIICPDEILEYKLELIDNQIKMKKISWLLIIVFILVIRIMIFRLWGENSWIKDSREVWVKHSVPFEIPGHIKEQQDANWVCFRIISGRRGGWNWIFKSVFRNLRELCCWYCSYSSKWGR